MRRLTMSLMLLFMVTPLATASNNATIDDVGSGTLDQKAQGHLDEYAKLQATHPKSLGDTIAKELGGATITRTDGTRFFFDKHPYYSVVFVATPPGATDPKIYRIL